MNKDILTEDRRLSILKCLKAGNYRMSDVLLQAALKSIGCAAALSVVNGDLAWLDRQGLVSISAVGELTIALLRNEGLDVVDGNANVPGIAIPKPE